MENHAKSACEGKRHEGQKPTCYISRCFVLTCVHPGFDLQVLLGLLARNAGTCAELSLVPRTTSRHSDGPGNEVDIAFGSK